MGEEAPIIHVRKFGDAVNSGQATNALPRYQRCRGWSLVKRSGGIYFVGTVTGCPHICHIYIHMYAYMWIYTCTYIQGTRRRSTMLR